MTDVTDTGDDTGASAPAGAALEERIAALVGRPVGSRGGPQVAPDPVNQPMIRHWAAAFEDTNPIYTDPARAARSRFGEIVAPPLMLQTWTMATPKITGIAERGGSPVETEGPAPLAVLDDAGYVGTLATNSDFEILRYLHLGDVVAAESTIDAISEEKQTRLGPGRFVTWVTTYSDQHGEVVGRQVFRILKFKPGGGTS
ncbi:MAG TPA: MaoC family dehydratase N-terminal domain-containing protein [Acidimicrobiales bacterium]|nr:MaoC family dehydratase N-terminal domain-containing protein [Acidimicrobiales bacterium]